MNLKPRRHRAVGHRIRMLSAAIVVATGAFGASAIGTYAAHADVSVTTLYGYQPLSYGPDVAGEYSDITAVGTRISISCYLTGDTVSGKYGTENVWDLVSGGPAGTATGSFVPDADVYTGSNSPVVSRCSTAPGTTIGGSSVTVYNGPGTNYGRDTSIPTGVKVEMRCYTTGTAVSGPYGSEKVWDLLTLNDLDATEWVPDALIYTGSNSPVVPHC